MDLTPMAIKQMLKTFPHLAIVPPDAPEGLDTPLPPPPPVDWSRSGNVIPLNGQKKAETGEDGKASAEDEVEDVPSTWEDWALCFGAEIMMQVREEVWTRLHYTCSAVSFEVSWYLLTKEGIAHNKSLAKVGLTKVDEAYPSALLVMEEAKRPDRPARSLRSKISPRHAVHGRELAMDVPKLRATDSILGRKAWQRNL